MEQTKSLGPKDYAQKRNAKSSTSSWTKTSRNHASHDDARHRICVWRTKSGLKCKKAQAAPFLKDPVLGAEIKDVKQSLKIFVKINRRNRLRRGRELARRSREEHCLVFSISECMVGRREFNSSPQKDPEENPGTSS